MALARRESSGGWDVFEVPLPAVISVKEGINLPRYPSIPGRLRARRKPIERVGVEPRPGGLEKVRLRIPEGQGRRVEVLGRGPEAAPRVVEVIQSLGLIRS
jgi:electron transfer flavoprotein beta subunit